MSVPQAINRSNEINHLMDIQRKPMGRRIAYRIALGVLAVGIGFGVIMVVVPDRAIHQTPAGKQRLESIYVPMRDGMRLAVDVWYPPGYRDEKLPALVRFTPYWRSMEMTRFARALNFLGLGPDLTYDHSHYPDVSVLARHGYVVLVVDARGAGASFGKRPILFQPAEIADYGQIVDWIVAQPWSDGAVGVFGYSYGGIAAERAAGLHHPAVKAIAAMFSPFDIETELVRINGVRNSGFLRQWSVPQRSLDSNDLCLGKGVTCSAKVGLFVDGVRRVTSDTSGAGLAKAVAEHSNSYPDDALSHTGFRDDQYGESGLNLTDTSPYGNRTKTGDSDLPFFVVAGYQDSGIITGAITRYSTLPNAQELTIGPFSHGAYFNTDPFRSAGAPAVINPEQLYERTAAFFDRYLKPDGQPISGKAINYYVEGPGTWRRSASWPPDGVAESDLYLSQERLTASAPDGESSEAFKVDFEGTSGLLNRWLGTGSRNNVEYPPNYLVTKGSVTYTTEPFVSDQELAGTPALALNLSSDATDGALFAHLQEISPDGTATYITEGMLRLLDRKSSTTGAPLISGMGISRTFLKADAMQLAPGVKEKMLLQMEPVSVLVHRGDRLRLVIFGADASTMDRYPVNGAATVHILDGGQDASRLALPLKPWASDAR